jgi:hypothetical protein
MLRLIVTWLLTPSDIVRYGLLFKYSGYVHWLLAGNHALLGTRVTIVLQRLRVLILVRLLKAATSHLVLCANFVLHFALLLPLYLYRVHSNFRLDIRKDIK